MAYKYINPPPAYRPPEKMESDYATIAEVAPKLGQPFSTLEPIGLTGSGQVVAIYTPSVSQTASAVLIMVLDQSKGPFKNVRSPCVVKQRCVVEAVSYRGRRIEDACIVARRQARLMCNVVFH